MPTNTLPSPQHRRLGQMQCRMAWHGKPCPSRDGLALWIPSVPPSPGPRREGPGRLGSALEQKPWWEVGDCMGGGRWSRAGAGPAGVQTGAGSRKQMDKFQVVLSLCFSRGLEARGAQGHWHGSGLRRGCMEQRPAREPVVVCAGVGVHGVAGGSCGGGGAGTPSVVKMQLA